jgi:hypothetical protein
MQRVFGRLWWLPITVAGFVVVTPTPASGYDICRARPNEPAGCFDLRLARKYEEWGRWKEAEQEYIQAGRIGAPCVRKEALEAIQQLKKHRPRDESNFELDLGETYSKEGAWKESEQHYSAAGRDRTEEEWKKPLKVIEKIRESENFNFELAVADKYKNLGALPEAEQHYSAAGKEGTDQERKKALIEINTIRNGDNYNCDLALAHKYRDLHAWEAAEQHYSDAGKNGTASVRQTALKEIKKGRYEAGLDSWPSLDWLAEKMNNWNDKVNHILGLPGTFIVAVAGLLIALSALLTTPPFFCRCARYFRGVEILPFTVSQEGEAERLAFALAHARRSFATQQHNLPQEQFVDTFFMPGDEAVIPELVELGSVTLPLAAMLRTVLKPKILVKGFCRIGGSAEAMIERRGKRRSHQPAQPPSVGRPIPSGPEDLRDHELDGFAGDVIENAWNALNA